MSRVSSQSALIAFCTQRTDESKELEAADEMKIAPLSDVDDDLLEQLGDEKIASLTSDVAVAAAKKMLFQRDHKGKSCLN